MHIPFVKSYIQQGLIEDEIRGITTSSARRFTQTVDNIHLDKREGAPKAELGVEGQTSLKQIRW